MLSITGILKWSLILLINAEKAAEKMLNSKKNIG